MTAPGGPNYGYSGRLESREVHRETFEIGERAVAEGTFVGGPQDYAGRLPRLQCFLPTRCTETPAVATPQAGKAEFQSRR